MRPTITLEASLLAARRTTTACPGLAQWLPVWRESQAASADGDCFGAAVTASLQADRLAWAFFCGYQGAVQAAFQTGLGTLGALSANESQRKITEIQTRLVGHSEPWQLVGSKSWVISGIDALTLFVLARRSDGPPQGPGSLCIVRVPLRSAGVAATAPRAHAVMPELPHAGVDFHEVPVRGTDILAGDGYADCAKPFRLREDVFVTACVLAYLIGESQVGAWSTDWTQRAVAAITLLEACSRRDPRHVDTAIVVAGALAFANLLIEDVDSRWTSDQQAARERWLRDKPILLLGQSARHQRTLRAWRAHGRDEADTP